MQQGLVCNNIGYRLIINNFFNYGFDLRDGC